MDTASLMYNMSYTPHYFQVEARDALLAALLDPNKRPYASIMTALGKSVILAEITRHYLHLGARILQLAPTKELIRQNYERTVAQLGRDDTVGIYCKQLGLTQLNKPCVIAMPSSLLSARHLAAFDVILIDECHFVSNDPVSTYRKIFDAQLKLNPGVKFAGVTATPYRLGQGMLHQDCLKGERFFTDLVYDTSIYPGIPRLVAEGYLAPIKTLNANCHVDLTGVKMSGDEYNQGDVGKKFDLILEDMVEDIQRQIALENIETFLIFSPTVKNCERIASLWRNPHEIRVLHGGSHTRDADIQWLKHGTGRRGIVNPVVLGTGFDMPHLDYIAIAGSTTSPGRLIQWIGRVIRPFGEKVGKLSDYGTNLERLGSIENIVPPKNKKELKEAALKSCKHCYELNRLSAKFCSNCDYEFISGPDGTYKMRSKAEAMEIKRMDKLEYISVQEVFWSLTQELSGSKIIMYVRGRNGVDHAFSFNLDIPGRGYLFAADFFQNMFADETDFYEVCREGLTNTNMVYLLDKHPELFRHITTLAVDKIGRYKIIVGVEYEQDTAIA